MKGMKRKRLYFCTVCWDEMREYPALVENSAQLVCEKCQKEREENEEKRHNAVLNNSNKGFSLL